LFETRGVYGDLGFEVWLRGCEEERRGEERREDEGESSGSGGEEAGEGVGCTYIIFGSAVIDYRVVVECAQSVLLGIQGHYGEMHERDPLNFAAIQPQRAMLHATWGIINKTIRQKLPS